MRLEPRHVDYRAGTCYVHGRYKGKKAIPPRTVPVTADGAGGAAGILFAHGASGPAFSLSSMWKTFRLAVETASRSTSAKSS